MRLWQIWCEGQVGMDGVSYAILMGEETADSFQSACDQLFGHEYNKLLKAVYQSDGLYYYGMKLHDSERGAREYERREIYPKYGPPSTAYINATKIAEESSKVRIVAHNKFPGGSVSVSKGDVIKLTRNGELVHVMSIQDVRQVSMWAAIKIGNLAVGYVCGGDDLLDVLRRTMNVAS